MTDPKVAKRIEDLVRLASDPGASEGERVNASREVVRLMALHEVRLTEPPPSRARRKSSRQEVYAPQRTAYEPPAPFPTQSGWRASKSRDGERCAMCSSTFTKGEIVWRRPDGTVIHGDDDWAEEACGKKRNR